MTKVETFQVHGKQVDVGDYVQVLPSRKGKKDGFVARVLAGELGTTGTLASVAVVHSHMTVSKKAISIGIRSLKVERIAVFSKAKQARLKSAALDR